MSFQNHVVLVTGGSGRIGGGAIRAFLDEGASVIAPSRTFAGTQKIRERYGQANERLLTLIADVSDPHECEALLSDIYQFFPSGVDHVVSCSGFWWHVPPFHELPYQTFREAMTSNFEVHFTLYRTFSLHMRHKKHATYTIITGQSGDSPSAGLTGVTQAAVWAFAAAVMKETKALALRVNEIQVGMYVGTDEEIAKMSQVAPYQSNSTRFGRMFTAVALGHTRGEIIRVNDTDDLDNFRLKVGAVSHNSSLYTE